MEVHEAIKYLHERLQNGLNLYQGPEEYFYQYNNLLIHQALNFLKPLEVYKNGLKLKFPTKSLYICFSQKIFSPEIRRYDVLYSEKKNYLKIIRKLS